MGIARRQHPTSPQREEPSIIDLNRKATLFDDEEAAIQKQIADDPDDPEWTDVELGKARPFRLALPELAASIDRAIQGQRQRMAVPDE